MDFEKAVDTAKIVVGAAFAVFAVWGFVFPIDEATILSLIELIAIIIGGFIGGPAVIRKLNGQKLTKVAE